MTSLFLKRYEDNEKLDSYWTGQISSYLQFEVTVFYNSAMGIFAHPAQRGYTSFLEKRRISGTRVNNFNIEERSPRFIELQNFRL